MNLSIKTHLPNIFKIIALAILLKLAYFLLAFLLDQAHLVPDTLDKKYIYTIELFKRNDSGWYEKIVKEGYEHLNENDWKYIKYSSLQLKWAFFPLYPLLIKSTMLILHTDFTSAAFINAFITSILCFIIFYFISFDFFQDKNKSFFTTLLFIAFPFHYYFSMLYSESLFACLLMICFLFIKNKKYILLMICSMSLVLCRVNGIVMMLPLAIFMFEQEKIIEQYKINISKIDLKLVFKLMLFFAMLLSFAVYCYYQKQLTGTYFAFSRAQSGWWRSLKMPYESFFASGDFQSQFNSIYTMVFLLIAILGFKKLPLSYNILIWISMLLPLISGTTLSMQRFIIMMFPFMLLIGDFIYSKIPKLKFAILFVLLLLQLTTFYYWIISDSFSF